MASTSIHSTPSKKGTSARNSARMPGKTVDDVIEGIEIDVAEVHKVDFTSFLCLFLSRCFVGDKKSEFESLQLEIEQLQRTRLGQADVRQTPKGVDEEEGTVHKPAEHSAAECEWVQRRDELLKGVLEETLESIVGIANNGGMREKLRKFAKLVQNKSPEKDRFPSYVHMYNSALDELAKTKISFLRGEDSLGLCLCRADPKEITSTFSESQEKTERKPDFVRTSKAVALNAHEPDKLGAEPTTGFEWHQVLSCEEMRTANAGITQEVQAVPDDNYKFEATEFLDKPGLEWLEPITPADILDSLSNTPSQSKRLRSESSANVQRGAKRARLSSTVKKTPGNSNAKSNIGARAQVAEYAMEMMSYSPGVVHVINTLIVDDRMFIWYYDRQGIMWSSGISIIADFPLFLVLLLAFQRFIVDDWGVVPFLNPQMLNSLEIDELVDRDTRTVELSQNLGGFHQRMNRGDGPVRVHLNDYLSSQPHCLSGRMTSVLTASLASNNRALACKIYSPEVQRIREDDVLEIAKETAKKHGDEMLAHLPKLYLSGDFDAGNTLRVRSVLGISGGGHRTLRMVVMNKLVSITSLSDAASILKAWFDIIAVHAFLWTHGIEHGDPSLWNMMADQDGGNCGVLTDYDLSVLVWLKRVPGTDRTGTIPFMALELLHDDYWKGTLKRYYHHEFEAILWALIAVSVGFKQGKFKPWGTPIQSWFIPDHNICREKKTDFVFYHDRVPAFVCADFRDYEWLISDFVRLIKSQNDKRQDEESHNQRTGAPTNSSTSQIQHSGHTWGSFITIIPQNSILIDIIKLDQLKKWKPDFNFGQNHALVAEMHCLTDNLFQIGTYE